MRRPPVLLAVAALFLLAGSVLAIAMSSASFRLEWFTPLTSGGGGAASSADYAVNVTIGQTATSISASADYGCCLGYWCGVAVPYRVYLPLVLRSD
jgi:hypothetical protein